VRRQLREADPVDGAGEVLAIDRVGLTLLGQRRQRVQHALALAQRRLHRIDQAAVRLASFDHQAVDDDLNVVLALLVELDLLVERPDHAVDARASEPALPRVRQHLLVLSLALLDERREQRELRAFGKPRQLLRDLLRALLADAAAADGAVLLAHGCEQHAQIVVDLGDGPDRRPRVVRGGLLLDRGKPPDDVVVRLLHLPEELPRVRGKRLHVPALPLGVQRVERERALSGPRDAGEHHQPLLGDLQRDALEVVLTGTLHEDDFGLHRSRAG